jgi:hypothetical protein
VTSDDDIVSILDYVDENLSQVELVIIKNMIIKVKSEGQAASAASG